MTTTNQLPKSLLEMIQKFYFRRKQYNYSLYNGMTIDEKDKYLNYIKSICRQESVVFLGECLNQFTFENCSEIIVVTEDNIDSMISLKY